MTNVYVNYILAWILNWKYTSLVRIYPKCICIYGFVNKFWTGRIFERLRKVCGGSNLSTVLLLWGIYIKKCISLVRICLQTRNGRNASTKFRKTLESGKWSIRFANMKHKPAACMKRRHCRHEAKRAAASQCAEGTLHRAKPCFTSWYATRFMRRRRASLKKARLRVLFSVTCVRFRCKTVCGWFRCTPILQRVD